MSIRTTLRTILTLGRGVSRGLTELTADDDPIALFGRWFDDAGAAGLLLPEAMTLATATADGVPSARMVLLKGYDSRGFVFYTNYESRKSQELTNNPRAALVFHWAVLQRQVRIEGRTERVTAEESSAYFRTRGRGSRIGAWASKQSQVLPARTTLEERVREFEQQFRGEDIPVPPYWGGYRLSPTSIEFWQGRADRLHDRLRYVPDGDRWEVTRLYP